MFDRLFDRFLKFCGKKDGEPCWLLIWVGLAIFLWCAFQPCPGCEGGVPGNY